MPHVLMLYYRIACVALLVIGLSHLAGHFFLIPHFQLSNNFTGLIPANTTEEKILELMNDYHRSVGGKPMSFMDIQDGLSLCYSLFFFWTGILGLIIGKGLVRNKRMLSQICFVNVAVLLVGAFISFKYFFWLPILSFITAAVLFVVAAYKMKREF
jgi:hypothetical protein